jgi:hypothetical protein
MSENRRKPVVLMISGVIVGIAGIAFHRFLRSGQVTESWREVFTGFSAVLLASGLCIVLGGIIRLHLPGAKGGKRWYGDINSGAFLLTLGLVFVPGFGDSWSLWIGIVGVLIFLASLVVMIILPGLKKE